MAGNVMEWTDSHASQADQHTRIVRGGDAFYTVASQLADVMGLENPRAISFRDFALGLRCAVSSAGPMR